MAVKDSSKKGVASIALLEVGLFEVGFVVLVIGIILFILNYFNIISLSQIYPKYFGFLPHQSSSKSTTQIQSEKLILVSPMKQEDLIEIRESEGRLLLYLKDNAQLFPAMDGVVTQGGGVYSKVNPPQNFRILWIRNNLGQELEYRFVGNLIGVPDKVSSGDTQPMAQIGKDNLKTEQNASLVLTLRDSNKNITTILAKELQPRK